jgi:hypothetical protein
MLFCNPSSIENPLCKTLALQNLDSIIDILLEPDSEIKVEGRKAVPRPKYSPPTQTLLNIFSPFISPYIRYPF